MTALAHARSQLPETDTVAVSTTALTRTYGEGGCAVKALRGVSLEVPKGQFTAVLGPPGAGKSTLLHLMAGLDTPDAGSVRIAGEDITRLSGRDLTRGRRRHIGFVFEACTLLPTLPAEENIALALSIAGRTPEPDTVDRLLDRMRLTSHREHKPAQLSGGQRQRVAVARALIAAPTVLLADEPTGDLDPAEGAEVLERLRAVVDEDGQTTVMATRDARAAAWADRVLLLAGGRVVADLQAPGEAAILAALREVA